MKKMPPGGATPDDPETEDNEAVEDPDTVRRELGHDDTNGTPDCTQRQGLDRSGDSLMFFMAADGGDDISIVVDDGDTSAGPSGTQYQNTASDSAMAIWVNLYNNLGTTKRPIKTIRLPVDGDGNATSDAADRAGYVSYPAVSCAMVEDTSASRNQNRDGAFKISASSSHCSSTANHAVTLWLGVTLDELSAENADILPGFTRAARYDGVDYATEATLRVVCPSSSAASQGQELVPDNPFTSVN